MQMSKRQSLIITELPPPCAVHWLKARVAGSVARNRGHSSLRIFSPALSRWPLKRVPTSVVPQRRWLAGWYLGAGWLAKGYIFLQNSSAVRPRHRTLNRASYTQGSDL
jgi:hypothetical protein